MENFVDDYLIFDTRNHLGFASALWTDRHIDEAYMDVGQGREQERKL
jgi:hypothetical protein